MIENETPKKDKEFGLSAKIAAGIVGGALIVGAGGAVERGIREEQRVAAITADYEHSEAILDEIDQKAQELADLQNDKIVGLVESIGESPLYDTMLTFIPGEQSNNDFVEFTILESSQAQGVYQAEDAFALVSDTVDGEPTYIVQRVDREELAALTEDTQLTTLETSDGEEATLPSPITH